MNFVRCYKMGCRRAFPPHTPGEGLFSPLKCRGIWLCCPLTRRERALFPYYAVNRFCPLPRRGTGFLPLPRCESFFPLLCRELAFPIPCHKISFSPTMPWTGFVPTQTPWGCLLCCSEFFLKCVSLLVNVSCLFLWNVTLLMKSMTLQTKVSYRPKGQPPRGERGRSGFAGDGGPPPSPPCAVFPLDSLSPRPPTPPGQPFGL